MEGRLTLADGVAHPNTNISASSDLYYTPFHGNRVALYDSGAWVLQEFSQVYADLTTATSGINKNYDVFLYNNSGTHTLELVEWTDDSNRATELATQDGIYVQDSAPNKRYVGSVRIGGGAGFSHDETRVRFLWNQYNRVKAPLFKGAENLESPNDYWSFTNTAGVWHHFGTDANGAGPGQIGFNIIEILDPMGATQMDLTFSAMIELPSAASERWGRIGIGDSASTAISGSTYGIARLGAVDNDTSRQSVTAHFSGYAAKGHSRYFMIMQRGTTNAVTFFENNTAMHGTWEY